MSAVSTILPRKAEQSGCKDCAKCREVYSDVQMSVCIIWSFDLGHMYVQVRNSPDIV